MKVLVLGAGVIGVTSAYVLATRGYEVEVIDRAPHAAAETSFANGGQLSYSHAEPWANTRIVPEIFKWMFNDTAPLIMRPRLDYRMFQWSLKFLANCSKLRTEANSVTLLRLGLYSRKKMEQLATLTGIDFNYQHDGVLHVFSRQSDFDAAKRQVEFQEKFGCQENIKTVEECLHLEPTLEHTKYKLIGGIHAHLDESGDAHAFTTKLAELCTQEYGVKFHYNTTINKIKKDRGKQIAAIVTNQGEFTADHYVMSLGSYSSIYLRKLGISVPVYPMKGYSLTLKANMHTPKIGLTDQKAKIVYSCLGDRLRVAGTAEFAGYNDRLKPKRLQTIKKSVRRMFPKALESDDAILSEWTCLRPATPDGPPIIGPTPYSNLFVNTGHGPLGWTQAAGSAFLLADSLESKETEISLNGLELKRYL